MIKIFDAVHAVEQAAKNLPGGLQPAYLARHIPITLGRHNGNVLEARARVLLDLQEQLQQSKDGKTPKTRPRTHASPVTADLMNLLGSWNEMVQAVDFLQFYDKWDREKNKNKQNNNLAQKQIQQYRMQEREQVCVSLCQTLLSLSRLKYVLDDRMLTSLSENRIQAETT